MASNLTPYYGLSQWKGTDNFSRADFNSDNSKIDTALANLRFKQDAQPWVLVAKNQPYAELSSLSLSLEDKNLSDYLYLMLVVDIIADEDAESYFYVRLNGDATASYFKAGDTSAKNYFARVDMQDGYPRKRVIRFAPYEGGAYVCGTFESFAGIDAGTNNIAATGVKWKDLTSFDLAAATVTVPLKMGTGMYLYGIKKP